MDEARQTGDPAFLAHAESVVARARAYAARDRRANRIEDLPDDGADVREGDVLIEAAERLELSERDSLFVLDLLEKPPAPNARLRAAMAATPKGA